MKPNEKKPSKYITIVGTWTETREMSSTLQIPAESYTGDPDNPCYDGWEHSSYGYHTGLEGDEGTWKTTVSEPETICVFDVTDDLFHTVPYREEWHDKMHDHLRDILTKEGDEEGKHEETLRKWCYACVHPEVPWSDE